jgi:hypothetical protein
VWVSLALTIAYVILHAGMLSAALTVWGGLLSALILGR